MKVARALWAGLLGALVMTLMGAGGRMMGVPANLEMMLGTMFGLPAGNNAWAVGFAIHLLNGGIFGLIYGWLFERFGRGRAGTGVFISIPHAVAAGIFMAMVPALHPMIPEQMPAPGAFMINLGIMGVIAEFVMHAVFGAIVGGIYGDPRTRTAIAKRNPATVREVA